MPKNHFFRYISILVIMLACLTSCFNMKIDLNFDKKSGKMTMEYDINDEYFQLISIVMSNVQISENVFFDPFVLLDEVSFKTFYDSLPKDNVSAITLSSVSIKRNEQTGYYKGKIVFAFKDFEKCMALIPAGVSGLEFTKEKNVYTFAQTIDMSVLDKEGMFENFITTLKEDDVDFYKLLTEQAVFNFGVQLKSKILKSEGVKTTKDGMGANYSFKVNDLLNTSKEPLKFMISF